VQEGFSRLRQGLSATGKKKLKSLYLRNTGPITAKLLKGGVKAPFEAKFYGLDNKKTELKARKK